MRIVQCVDQLGIGGLHNHVLDLCRLLQEAGHEVVLLHTGETVPEHLDLSGVASVSAPALTDGDTAVLDALRPDLVHVHLLQSPAAAHALAETGVPVVRSYHDYLSMCLRRGRRRWSGDRCGRPLGVGCVAFGCLLGRGDGPVPVRLMNMTARLDLLQAERRFDLHVAATHHMCGVLAVNGFAAGRTRRIPYFSRFEDVARCGPRREPADWSEPGRTPELLFVGQLVAGKGLEVLIEALARLPARSWRLHVVGDGPRRDASLAASAAAGIADRIVWHGWVAQGEISRHYAAADLLVLPSVWDDPGPLVGIEAMSFGTPVVAFPVGGIPDYVLDDRTGRLAAEVSAAALRAALADALDRPERWPAWSEAARRQVVACHTRAAHLRALEAAYATAVAAASHHPRRLPA